MSTVESSDKLKQENNKIYNELCYQEFLAAVIMHRNVMQIIEKSRERAQTENEKEIHHQKEQEAYINSILEYNETIRKSIENDPKSEKITSIDQMQALLNSMLTEIKNLKFYIQELDNKIIAKEKDISGMKNSLAQEIKKYFTEHNSEINNIRIKSLKIEAPTNERDKFDNSGHIEIDLVAAYIRFANNVGKKLSANEIQPGQIGDQKEAAKEAIRGEISRLLTRIPQQNRHAFIDNLIRNDANLKSEISLAASQFAVKLPKDFAKNPAIATLTKQICHQEREKELLIIERKNAIDKLRQIEALTIKTQDELSLSTSNKSTTQLDITNLENKLVSIIENNQHPATAALSIALQNTDRQAAENEKAVSDVRSSLKDNPTPDEQLNFTSKAQQAAETLARNPLSMFESYAFTEVATSNIKEENNTTKPSSPSPKT